MKSFPKVFMLIVICGFLCYIIIQKYTGRTHLKYPQLTLAHILPYKTNWTGDCSFPDYIAPAMQAEAWFPLYLTHLQRVRFSSWVKQGRVAACSRWWYPTPQLSYHDVPPRKHRWKPKPHPPAGYKRPNCIFGQKLVPKTKCATKHGELWRTLDRLGVLYFPRSGSELGVVRHSSYLTTDGDVDVFVDLPQDQLLHQLNKSLSPPPIANRWIMRYNTEIHWKITGCPTVHMVFNDWITEETTNIFGRPTHTDTCSCFMNSIPLTCHREGERRMYVQYGPSWYVPLHAKQTDMPYDARNYNIVGKLQTMVSQDGVIREQTVRGLDTSIKFSAEEMKLILAQLNVMKALIDYHKATGDYDVGIY